MEIISEQKLIKVIIDYPNNVTDRNAVYVYLNERFGRCGWYSSIAGPRIGHPGVGRVVAYGEVPDAESG